MKVEQEIFRLLNARGDAKTICPSEVARSLWPTTWRDHMDEVRQVAIALVRDNRLVMTQKGKIIDPGQIRGPIRLSKPVD